MRWQMCWFLGEVEECAGRGPHIVVKFLLPGPKVALAFVVQECVTFP